MLVPLLAGGPPALADTVTIEPVRDTTLHDEDGAGSNGSGPNMRAALTRGGNVRRALAAFDVAAAVPAGSVVTSVRLDLTG